MTSLAETGMIEDFEAGLEDIASVLRIPAKLYGREQEIKDILTRYEQIQQGGKEILFIAGVSGIGKSALVRETFLTITQTPKDGLKPHLISGKFDQYQHNVPYYPLIQAFQELVRQILTQNEAQIARWQARIFDALGSNSQIMVDVIPELAWIIGEQTSVSPLPPEESRNRFHLVFCKFVSTFATKDHPLILFLDDLQWADSSSLKLIELLASDTDLSHFLLIGAFRSNEIDALHPFSNTLALLNQKTISNETIELTPLTFDQTSLLITETLFQDQITLHPLTDLLYQKTRGNPFFLEQILQTLFDEQLLIFDQHHGMWQWDVIHIQNVNITDNVVDLMEIKIKKLSSRTQNLLKLAACIGNPFDFQTLTMAYGQTREETLTILEEALTEGLILPQDALTASLPVAAHTSFAAPAPKGPIYRFLHDRVQQAAYSLLSDTDKKKRHLGIGRLLLQHTREPQLETRIFDIVNHLNQGKEWIKEPSEVHRLVELNLLAGKKARSAVAFLAAYTYFQEGLSLLNANCWETHYDLALSLYMEAAEAAYLISDYDQMTIHAETALAHTTALLDKIKIYEILIQGDISRHYIERALSVGLPIIKQLGITLPANPGYFHLFVEHSRLMLQLRGKKIETLIDLPVMTDPHQKALMRLLFRIASAAYLFKPKLYHLLILILIRLSLKHGNHPLSAAAYVCYGPLLCHSDKNIELAYQMGQMGLKLIERFGTKENLAKILLLFNNIIRQQKEPVINCLEPLRQSYQTGVETGDLLFAAYSAYSYAVYFHFAEKDITVLEKEVHKWIKAITQLNQEGVATYCQIWRQKLLNLMGRSEDPCRMVGEAYDETKMVPLHLASGDYHALFGLYLHKSYLFAVFNDYKKALEYIRLTEKYIDGVGGFMAMPQFYFLDSLCRLAIYQDLPPKKQKRALRRVRRNQKKMKKWATHAPMNFLHKYYFIEAEIFRALEDEVQARLLYDKAVELVQTNSFFLDPPFYHELIGRFWLERGQTDFALVHIKKAYHLYHAMKCRAKIEHMQKAYAHLFIDPLMPKQDLQISVPAIEGVLPKAKESLDLKTVMQASQAISGEMMLDKLLRKLMEIAITNAGARTGFLIMHEDGMLLIKGHASIDHIDKTGRLYRTAEMPVEESHELCLAVVQYVMRTQKNVVLSDAKTQGMFTHDDYVIKNQACSMLCIPIRFQGSLTGILYLENNLITNAFTPERVEVLKLLASQAAISIENARHYTKFRSLYDNAVEGIFQISTTGGFLSANPAMASILGYDDPDSLIAEVKDVTQNVDLNPPDRKRFLQQLNQKGRLTDIETRFTRRDGSLIWISVSARAVRDSHGHILYYEGSVIDISERKEKEKAEKEREMAEAANHAKSQFLANMSHEIRTPMNAIINMTQMALRQKPDAKITDYLTTVHFSAQSLLKIINDILDFSKIEAGKLELEATGFAITTIIESLFGDSGMFQQAAQKKGISLDFVVEDAVPPRLVGDATRLGQILINLTNNAIKFTPAGNVSIRIACDEKDETHARLLFSVTDTGIGIQEDQLATLFTPFTQADSSFSRKYGGSGLGLSISKQLVSMMGGDIWVTRNHPQGSVFCFTARFPIDARFPAQNETGDGKVAVSIPGTPTAGGSEQEMETALKGALVLIVEDNPFNQKVAAEILRIVGIDPDLADNGKEALVAVTQKRYDLILMDIQMPEMDGYETTRAIRDLDNLKEVPIIAMTAHVMAGDHEKSLSAGMNDFIGKPIDSDLLYTKLKKWLAPTSPEAPVAQISMASHPLATNPTQMPDQLPGIDIATCLKRFGGREKLFLTLFQDFIQNQVRLIPEIQRLIQQNQMEAARKVAHTLKGVAGNISALPIMETAYQIEKALDQEDLTALPALNAKLDQALEEIRTSFGALQEFYFPPQDSRQSSPQTAEHADPAQLAPLVAELEAYLLKCDPLGTERILTLLKQKVGAANPLLAQIEAIEAQSAIFDYEAARKIVLDIRQHAQIPLHHTKMT